MSIANRYEFVYLFDVTNGNPNGDPDAGNLPRLDPETNQGLISDVCLKRKIRNFVHLAREDAPGYNIYMQEKAVLNNQHRKAWDALEFKPEKGEDFKKLPKDEQKARQLTGWMCKNFYDVRTFGAVMTTGVNAGQVRGPVQLCFGESIDPVVPLEMSITRMAATEAKEDKDNKTMGRKQYVPYGLYRIEGFVSASLAEKNGFCQADLDLLWEALMNMFENDRSAARGLMTSRELIVFKHESKFGNAPAHRLFDLVHVDKVDSKNQVAREFGDYTITIDEGKLPQGVEIRTYDYIAPSA